MRFLFRPGWLVLAAVVAAFAFACFYVLAPWQLGKNTDTERRNQQIADSIDQEPVPVGELLAGGTLDPSTEWHPVVAEGTYVPGSDLLVRLRSIDGQPAYEVLTAFALDDGGTLLVNRGYVRPVEGTQPPPLEPAPTGHVSLDGRVRASEGVAPGKDPLDENGVRQVYTIDAGQIAQFTGTDLLDGYLQLDDGQPGGLGTIALPQLDAGPYLSYGLQWLAFGIMAPLGLAYFVRAELRERRKTRAAAAGSDDAADPHTHEPRPAATHGGDERTTDEFDDIEIPRGPFRRRKQASTAPASSTKLADRYGNHR
nr:SURF1 family protein [Rhodococcus sp. HNM0569]